MKVYIYSPIGMYSVWVIVCFVFWFSIPLLDDKSDPSAQIEFILRTYALIGLVIGLFIISLLNIFLFKGWFKKFWYLNGFITLITGVLIMYFIVKIITV
jgi:UDP-N-acetylmuramyl pentapeptide phosphotransferase/UDP-N-acetylglucosamine-1-phosphate transferase